MTFLTAILFLIFAFPSFGSIREEFERIGYVEICDQRPTIYDALYANFDQFIEFLQANPVWALKLYSAKERFIRSKEKNYYSTDVFGFYNESNRSQISFYYSTHFHEFISARYPELIQIPEITHFLEACLEIQNPCVSLFQKAATELDIDSLNLFTLLKIIKYLPTYTATKPHYDGSAFSLFLNSTDNSSLLLSPYKSTFTTDDFSSPIRNHSVLLIPGTLLREFSIYPTPHIVLQSGKIRYATIAFAMRANYAPPKVDLSPLPHFND